MEQLPKNVTEELITCIGNKRRIVSALMREVSSCMSENGGTEFLDPMCGSGVVSRAARHLGCRVGANDWEPYAYTVVAPTLENDPDDLDALFADYGGLDAVYADLDTRRVPREPYISRYYAPRVTAQPRIGAERLFYTAENAAAIDAMRERIDELFPPAVADRDGRGARARRLLLASLLAAASVRANTSGVFKAYHRGFGGLGRDALTRITSPITLAPPPTPIGPRGFASLGDAAAFVRSNRGHICYLDPPYASHQYGSNYFMLNTILLWDRPEVDERRDAAGNLLDKAGIRRDWVKTRSPFCSRRLAAQAMTDLVEQIDADHLLVSYSTDGIVDLEELASILSRRGALTIRTIDYTTYRGGRQSNLRRSSNSELVFHVDMHSGRAGHGDDRIERTLVEARVRALQTRQFVRERLDESFAVYGRRVTLADGWHADVVSAARLAIEAMPQSVSGATARAVLERLESAACRDHREVVHELVSVVREVSAAQRRDAVGTKGACSAIESSLRKLAHPRYAEELADAVAEIESAALEYPDVFRALLGSAQTIVARARERIATRIGREPLVEPRPKGD